MTGHDTIIVIDGDGSGLAAKLRGIIAEHLQHTEPPTEPPSTPTHTSALAAHYDTLEVPPVEAPTSVDDDEVTP